MQGLAVIGEQLPKLTIRSDMVAVGQGGQAEGMTGSRRHQPALFRIVGQRPVDAGPGRLGVAACSHDGATDQVGGR